jgi:WD40 repeat protein/serine/threonine protein kinase
VASFEDLTMSDATPSQPIADRNLLFGILALQMDFISRDALIAAMHAWVLEKTKSLGEVLVEHNVLPPDQRAALEVLVKMHLECHEDNAEKSLAALGVPAPIRQELHSLGDGDVDASLARMPTPPHDASVLPSTTAEKPGVLGLRYRVLRPHGKGGIGEVFVALDQELNREIALKEIRHEHADDPLSRGRFVREAEITGGLEHPGIVPVYGLGQYSDGRPFYAMRFIQGETLKDAIARYHSASPAASSTGEVGARTGPRSPEFELRALLTRFVAVCNTIAYAHSRGVIHRDIKPSNIMLGKFGETLIVDWGLAKAAGTRQQAVGSEPTGSKALSESPARSASNGLPEPALVPRLAEIGETQAGAALGTPAYMSPEQAAGRVELLGPASDIYSLGATLYTLLTGRPPIEGKETAEILRKAQRGEWLPARLVKSDVPAALDAMCRKAMTAKPEERYATALELAADVERWLADQPVTAYSESLAARWGRWARKHKGLVGTAAACGVIALILTVAGLRIAESAHRADEQENIAGEMKTLRQVAEDERDETWKQKDIADQQERLARKYLYCSQVNLAAGAWKEAEIERMKEILHTLRPMGPHEEDMRGFEWHYLWRHQDASLLTLKSSGRINHVAYSRDGRLAACASDNGTITLWDASTGQQHRILKGHQGTVFCIAFSPDGKHLASSSQDGHVIVWNIETGNKEADFPWGAQQVGIAYHPDGKHLASAAGDGIRIWDIQSGKVEHLLIHQAALWVAYSHDGTRLASWGLEAGGGVKVWNTANGMETLSLQKGEDRVVCVAFSPDDKLVAGAGLDGNARVWDVRKGQESFVARGHGPVHSVAFSPDGLLLATAAQDRTIAIWHTRRGQELYTFRGHADAVRSVAFSPIGHRILSGSLDQTIKIWDTSKLADDLTITCPGGPVWAAMFAPNGSHLLSSTADGEIIFLNATTGKISDSIESRLSGFQGLTMSPDGKRLAFGMHFDLCVWDVENHRAALILKGHKGTIRATAYSKDGKRLASGSEDGTTRIWDPGTGKVERILPVAAMAFSPSGAHLASCPNNKAIIIWNVEDGKEVHRLEGHSPGLNSLAYSPDGRTLASAWLDRSIILWATETGRETHLLKGHSAPVTSVAFSPNGKRLASGSEDLTVKIWNAETGQETLTLKGSREVHSVAFSPDGNRLAATYRDGTIKIFDGTPQDLN